MASVGFYKFAEEARKRMVKTGLLLIKEGIETGAVTTGAGALRLLNRICGDKDDVTHHQMTPLYRDILALIGRASMRAPRAIRESPPDDIKVLAYFIEEALSEL